MEFIQKTIYLLVVFTGLFLSVLFMNGMVSNPLPILFIAFIIWCLSFYLHKKKNVNNLQKEYGIQTEYLYPYQKGFYSRSGKRLFDIVISLIGLIITAPIIIVFSVLIMLESFGSPFYLQERVGLNGRYFKIYKLRSMKKDAEKNGPQWANQNDPRITKIGMFIRKTRIDEFPQFLNILKGEMSMIGPRPERPFFTAQFHRNIPDFTKRLAVKPGLTGWAQINGGYDLNPEQKLKLDLHYINHKSFYLDLIILIKTIKIIITGHGAR